MDEEIWFHILGPGGTESKFPIFPLDTVGDLKKEIHKRFEIAPSNQIIEGWHKIPKFDSKTLTTCCSVGKLNELKVRNGEKENKTSSIDLLGGNDYDTCEIEISAIQSFKQYFKKNFDNTEIRIHCCLLEDALNKAFFNSDEKRVVVLYLHNRNEEFANFFCRCLSNVGIQEFLNNKSVLLCWNIEEDVYKSFLIKALHQNKELKGIGKYVESKTCVALVLVPKKNSFEVNNILRDVEEMDKILNSLRETEKYLICNTRFGFKEYQQLMLNMLGDRDYDSFEHDELKYLKSKIAFALFGPPQKITIETVTTKLQKFRNERDTSESQELETDTNLYDIGRYTKKQQKKINSLFDKIRRENNIYAKWTDRVIISFIYVCTAPLPKEKIERNKKYPDYDPYSDFSVFPIFVLRKCKRSYNPCRIFIDDNGRVYKSWTDYLENNKLPKCIMYYPENGRYREDENGDVLIEAKPSPACGATNVFLEGADTAAAVGGFLSGATMIAAGFISAVAAAPIVVPAAAATGIAAGVYSMGRSIHTFRDRQTHGESLSFFDSPEARGAYINIVAGSLGFVGAGANIAVSRLVSQGYNFGKGASATVNAINIANLGVAGVGVANASYDVIRKWWLDNEKPSALTILQLTSSILFFGHAVYNYRSFNNIFEESQAQVLREYQDSLRSNRHRKTFTKLMKETIRQNDGNVQRGRAEVISTIKNLENKDEVFATLTRTNKAMNRNNVRFAAQNGKLTLNGVPIDMGQFGKIGANEVITFLKQMSSRPNPTSPDVQNIKMHIQNTFGNTFRDINTMPLVLALARMFGFTSDLVIKKIFNAVFQLLTDIPNNDLQELDKIFPNYEKYFRLFGMVNEYFQGKVNEYENKYQQWLKSCRPEYKEPFFIRLSRDAGARAIEIFNFIQDKYFDYVNLSKRYLYELKKYFYTWFAKQLYLLEINQERKKQRARHATPKIRTSCGICGGCHYLS